MTIQFNCPKCGNLIAFPDKYAGKSAKCLNCGQKLIIPAKSGETPQKINPETDKTCLPGFYRAVFVDSWKIFLNKNNATSLVFAIAAVCFKFFSAGACCLAVITYFAAWGYLFGFYLLIIRETAAGDDMLPEIEVGTSISFLVYIFKPILTFAFALFITQLPFIIALAYFKGENAGWEEIWQTKTAVNLVLRGLFILGLFVFPMAILAAAIIEDLPELFRVDRLIVPVFKSFIAYLVVVVILSAACFLEMNTKQYSAGKSVFATAGNLFLNLLTQVIAIIAMRSIGLFYRHFACYFNY